MPSWLNPTEEMLAVAQALDLLADVAWHDGTDRELAVVAEAFTLVGFHDGAIDVSHAGGPDAVLARIARVRRGRPKRLLKADARGLVQALRMLHTAGLLEGFSAANARNRRWIERGGHDRGPLT